MSSRIWPSFYCLFGLSEASRKRVSAGVSSSFFPQRVRFIFFFSSRKRSHLRLVSRDDRRVPRTCGIHHHPRWHSRHHLRTRRTLHVPHGSQLARRSHRFHQALLHYRCTRTRSRRRWSALVIIEIPLSNTTDWHCEHDRTIDRNFHF
jgi:hypothetical protein